MMTTVDTTAAAPATPEPALGQASAIVTFGQLAWLGWTWLVAALVYAVVLTSVVIWGEVDVSLFQSVFAGWQRYVVFAAGITITTTFLRMLVRNGSTRALLSSASTVAMAAIAFLGTAIITIGWVIEKAVYDGQGWPQGLDSGAIFDWSDLWRVLLESPIVLAAYFVSGWLVGAGFYRHGVVGGLALLLPSLVPAALCEVVTTKDIGGLDVDVFPEFGVPTLVATVIAGVALVAASVAVARRVTITTPMRSC